MPIVHPCEAPGCSILTMGALCLEHELEREQADEAAASDETDDGALEPAAAS